MINTIITPILSPEANIRGNISPAIPLRDQVEAIVAAGGAATAWYTPNDRATLFQDITGTTAVVASGDPIALMEDISGNGNDASQASPALRVESWTDTYTGEVLLWDNVEDGPEHSIMLWPGVEGAVGTIGIAYTTGAQVFNMTAAAFVPRGPAMEIIFVEGILSDAQCTALHNYLDSKVVDSSWLGYVPGITMERPRSAEANDTPSNAAYIAAGVRAQFTVDGYIADDAWPDGFTNVMSLTVPRQRFKFVVENPEFFQYMALDLSYANIGSYDNNTVYCPDVTAAYARIFYPLQVYSSWLSEYGVVHWQQRGNSIDRIAIHYQNDGYTDEPYGKLYYSTLGPSIEVNDNTVSMLFTDYTSVPIHPMDGVGLPFAQAPNLLYVSDGRPAPKTGLLPNKFTNPKLIYIYTEYYTDAQAFPFFPNSLGYCSIYGCTGLSGVQLVGGEFPTTGCFMSIQTCGMIGPLPYSLVTNPYQWRTSRYFSGNSFTSYSGSHVLSVGVRTYGPWLYYQNNALDQASVDLLLQEAVDSPDPTAGNRLYINGGTNAVPSAAGLANKATLISRGWAVLTN